MKHGQAVALMVLTTLLWSIGGAVTRHLESARGFEITFWRSVFAALTVLAWFATQRASAPWKVLTQGGRMVWVSGLMWAIMFTCFMMALSLTSVANVLITQSLGPVFTALLAWGVLHKAVGTRTWIAIGVAVAGVMTMYIFDISGLDGRHLSGVALALGVPLAAAVNWILLQRAGRSLDLSGAVLVGALLSALMTLPMAWPLQASAHDFALMALLGVVQLGIPCLLVMRVARTLSGPEISLLGLLEVVFGIVLAWWFGGEQPGLATVIGGSVVLAALVFNERFSQRSTDPAPPQRPLPAPAAAPADAALSATSGRSAR